MIFDPPKALLLKPKLAQNTPNFEFGERILEKLKKHGAHLHGCPLVRVEPLLTGEIHLCFEGVRDGQPWAGKFKFQAHFLEDRKVMGSADAVTEIALQLLEKHGFLSIPPSTR